MWCPMCHCPTSKNITEVNHLHINSPYFSKYLKTKNGKVLFFVTLNYLISVFPKMAYINFLSYFLQSDFFSHFLIKNAINRRNKWFIFVKITFWLPPLIIFMFPLHNSVQCSFPLHKRRNIWNHKTASFGVGGDRQRGNPIPPTPRFWLGLFLSSFILCKTVLLGILKN